MLVDAHDQQMKGVQWDEVRAIEELEKELEERRPPMQVSRARPAHHNQNKAYI